jgi:hypothetical protein
MSDVVDYIFVALHNKDQFVPSYTGMGTNFFAITNNGKRRSMAKSYRTSRILRKRLSIKDHPCDSSPKLNVVKCFSEFMNKELGCKPQNYMDTGKLNHVPNS